MAGITFKSIKPDELGRILSNQSKAAKDLAHAALRKKTDEIVVTARAMAPIREGNLRDAINKRIFRNQYDKSSYVIYTAETINGVNVGDYMHFIHNMRYEPEGWKKLGKISESHNGRPERVGEKFMDRAFAKHEQDVYDKLEEALLKGMGL